MTTAEAKQTLMLELVRATGGNYSVEELIELFYFIIEPEEEAAATLTLIRKDQ